MTYDGMFGEKIIDAIVPGRLTAFRKVGKEELAIRKDIEQVISDLFGGNTEHPRF